MSAVSSSRAGFALAKKELKIYFFSPSAYAFLTAMMFFSAIFFALGIQITGEASLRGMMGNIGVVMLFCVPLLTTRQFAEEMRGGTLELLLTSPVSLGTMILAKWAAALIICAVFFLLSLVFPAVLTIYGEPDVGVMLTSYVGLLLVSSAFVAASLFASSVSSDSIMAGIGGVLVLLPFWLPSLVHDVVPEGMGTLIARFSFLDHLRSFSRGVLDLGDIFWFVGFTFVFLFLTWRSIESRRWR